MTWDYNYRDIPRLLTYEQAEAHWAKVKPYNKAGEFPGERPLGRRNRRAVRILKDDDGSIQIVYQWSKGSKRVTLARYVPDGIELSGTSKWDFDRGVLSAVLGHEVALRNSLPHIYCYGPTGVEGWYQLQTGTPMRLVWDPETRRLTLTNPVQPDVLRLDRAKWNEVKAPYARFVKYMRGIVNLREGKVFPAEEYAKRWGTVTSGHQWNIGKPKSPPSLIPHRVYYWDEPTDPEQASENRKELLRLALSKDPEDNFTALLWLNYVPHYASNFDRMAQTLYDVLRAENPEKCFRMAPVAHGSLTNDPYRKTLKRYGVEV